MTISGNPWQSVAIHGNHLQVLKEGGELGERREGKVLNACLALALFGAASAAAAASSTASTAAASAPSAAATPSIDLLNRILPFCMALLLGCLLVGRAMHPNLVGLWPLATWAFGRRALHRRALHRRDGHSRALATRVTAAAAAKHIRARCRWLRRRRLRLCLRLRRLRLRLRLRLCLRGRRLCDAHDSLACLGIHSDGLVRAQEGGSGGGE